jgi:hypothetical protein
VASDKAIRFPWLECFWDLFGVLCRVLFGLGLLWKADELVARVLAGDEMTPMAQREARDHK